MKVIKQAPDIPWSDFTYVVFDEPTQWSFFRERYLSIRMSILNGCMNHLIPRTGTHLESQPCKYVKLAPYQECKDQAHLDSYFQSITEGGGEGVVLRDPNQVLHPGRSSGFLKLKVYMDIQPTIS